MSKPHNHNPNKPKSEPTRAQADPSLDDLIGREDEPSVAPAYAELGQIVFFHSNNPIEDGILTRAAIVTKRNGNGSVSLTVFDETHPQYFSKIPFASAPLPGYYTIHQ